jgi:hypothetical protein
MLTTRPLKPLPFVYTTEIFLTCIETQHAWVTFHIPMLLRQQKLNSELVTSLYLGAELVGCSVLVE